MATRYVGKPDSTEAVRGINRWVGLFATACQRAVADADAFEKQITSIQLDWRMRLGAIRRNSAIDILIERIPGVPIATVATLTEMTGRSFQAINEAITRLVETRILSLIDVGAQRNRVFEARDVIQAFTNFERQLASPAGDTRIEAPARPVPKRPKAAD
jgi:hypothetical protein